MKKLYLFGLFLVCVLVVDAQDSKAKRIGIPTPFENGKLEVPPGLMAAGCDTLLWSPTITSQFGASVYVVDNANPLDSGFISGLNAYNDKQKGNRFDVTGSANSSFVTKVRFAFFRAKSNDMSKTISFKVYNVAGTSITLAGSSPELPLSAFTSLVGVFGDYTFPTPITLSSKQFIVSVDMSNLSFAAGDSLAIFQNNYSVTTNAPNAAVEQWNTDDWVGMSTAWGLPPTFLYLFPYVSDNPTCSLLPVKLSNLEAFKVSGSNKLTWSTLTEVDNKGFEVERSSDGQIFKPLGFVESMAPFGHSWKPISYEFLDNAPLEKGNFYRIKQIDRDGKFSYSNIVLLNRSIDKENGVLLNYPNPAKSSINLQLASSTRGNAVLTVTNTSGMVVLQQPVFATGSLQNFSLNVSNLPKGVYILRLSGESRTAKFIKE